MSYQTGSAADSRHPRATDAELVLALEHIPASLSRSSVDHCIFGAGVGQEDAGMVKAEAVADQINCRNEQFIQVGSPGHIPGYGSRNLELSGAAL